MLVRGPGQQRLRAAVGALPRSVGHMVSLHYCQGWAQLSILRPLVTYPPRTLNTLFFCSPIPLFTSIISLFFAHITFLKCPLAFPPVSFMRCTVQFASRSAPQRHPLGSVSRAGTSSCLRHDCSDKMLRCVSRSLWYQFKDLKSKTILEKLRNRKLQQGVHPSDLNMEELAKESGIAPPSSVSVQEFMHEKEAVLEMLQEQRLRRIARREAFLEWQAGQREKGAAHRLVRQSRKAEKYKRRHYHATSGRMLPLSVSPGEALPERHTTTSVPKACVSSTEFLRGGSGEKYHAIHLSLGKK